ncbi:MAG TPA: hypothetical protein VD997_05065 [Phycisphaerales bacterium]|nr:hypothetical protein [Phycisphaerales bacterium]
MPPRHNPPTQPLHFPPLRPLEVLTAAIADRCAQPPLPPHRLFEMMGTAWVLCGLDPARVRAMGRARGLEDATLADLARRMSAEELWTEMSAQERVGALCALERLA